MKLLPLYALGRGAFGAAALLAPASTGRLLAGRGGTEPDAQAFLRGMGGREIALAYGLAHALRRGGESRHWLIAGVLSDCGDMVGIAGAWQEMDPSKRWPGLSFGALAAATGLGLLATGIS